MWRDVDCDQLGKMVRDGRVNRSNRKNISERGTSNEQVENVFGIMSREGNVLGKGKGIKKFKESGRKRSSWFVNVYIKISRDKEFRGRSGQVI